MAVLPLKYVDNRVLLVSLMELANLESPDQIIEDAGTELPIAAMYGAYTRALNETRPETMKVPCPALPSSSYPYPPSSQPPPPPLLLLVVVVVVAAAIVSVSVSVMAWRAVHLRRSGRADAGRVVEGSQGVAQEGWSQSEAEAEHHACMLPT